MAITAKSKKTYHTHRENQRERILDAARRLFLGDGIDNVTLAAIAKAARVTRVTLYEYFPDKEEIAWGVFQKVIAEISTSPDGALSPGGNGYQKVERFLLASIARLETHLEQFRFIALFNFLYAREGSSERMRGSLEQAWPGYYGMLSGWMREGIADGSIHPDVDPDLASAAIYNLLAGMTSRFALLGANVEGEFRYESMQLLREICRNYLRGLRA